MSSPVALQLMVKPAPGPTAVPPVEQGRPDVRSGPNLDGASPPTEGTVPDFADIVALLSADTVADETPDTAYPELAAIIPPVVLETSVSGADAALMSDTQFAMFIAGGPSSATKATPAVGEGTADTAPFAGRTAALAAVLSQTTGAFLPGGTATADRPAQKQTKDSLGTSPVSVAGGKTETAVLASLRGQSAALVMPEQMIPATAPLAPLVQRGPNGPAGSVRQSGAQDSTPVVDATSANLIAAVQSPEARSMAASGLPAPAVRQGLSTEKAMQGPEPAISHGPAALSPDANATAFWLPETGGLAEGSVLTTSTPLATTSEARERPSMPEPAVARHVAHQMAVAVSTPHEHTTEIRLDPEELGRVRLSLQTADTAIVVVVHAERPETADLMRRHIDQLAQEFRSLGYQDVSFSFGSGEDRGDSRPRFLPGSEIGNLPTDVPRADGDAPTGPPSRDLPATGQLDLRL